MFFCVATHLEMKTVCNPIHSMRQYSNMLQTKFREAKNPMISFDFTDHVNKIASMTYVGFFILQFIILLFQMVAQIIKQFDIYLK